MKDEYKSSSPPPHLFPSAESRDRQITCTVFAQVPRVPSPHFTTAIESFVDVTRIGISDHTAGMLFVCPLYHYMYIPVIRNKSNADNASNKTL